MVKREERGERVYTYVYVHHGIIWTFSTLLLFTLLIPSFLFYSILLALLACICMHVFVYMCMSTIFRGKFINDASLSFLKKYSNLYRTNLSSQISSVHIINTLIHVQCTVQYNILYVSQSSLSFRTYVFSFFFT